MYTNTIFIQLYESEEEEATCSQSETNTYE